MYLDEGSRVWRDGHRLVVADVSGHGASVSRWPGPRRRSLGERLDVYAKVFRLRDY
jgi:hypothetical protein